jgi:uncharacterized membrane protein
MRTLAGSGASPCKSTAHGRRWAQQRQRSVFNAAQSEKTVPRNPTQLPQHVEDAITDISEVHAEYHRHARPLQKFVGALTGAVGKPVTLLIATAVITVWIAVNTFLHAHGRAAFDPPPFPALSCAASVAALYLAAMIVATQRHDDELALHRDQLTLELAILSDQKSAKIIRLLEEMRRNDPDQGNHADAEAEAMAVPANPKAVLDKLRSMQSDMSEG